MLSRHPTESQASQLEAAIEIFETLAAQGMYPPEAVVQHFINFCRLLSKMHMERSP